MSTEIQSLFDLIAKYGQIDSSNLYLVASLIFCGVFALYVISTVKNDYAIIAGVLIPITACTILKTIPPVIYILVLIAFSLTLAFKFFGGK